MDNLAQQMVKFCTEDRLETNARLKQLYQEFLKQFPFEQLHTLPLTPTPSQSKVEPVFEKITEMTSAPIYKPISNSIAVPLTESLSNPTIETTPRNSLTTGDRKSSKFEHLKIGEIVRTVVRDILQSGKVSAEEVEMLQTKSYCKQTFDIQYPLLVKASLSNGISPKRYYSQGLTIRSERYFLCSEWFEVPGNNDRPYLLKWINLYL